MRPVKTSTSKLRLRDFAKYAKPRMPGGKLAEASLEVLRIVVYIVGIVVGAVVLVIVQELARFINFLPFLIPLAIYSLFKLIKSFVKKLGSIIRIQARRIGTDSKKMLQDDRDPVLYLREFRFDSSHSFKHPEGKSSEQVLLSLIGDFGPVVAAGKPGEFLPLPGAVRLYFDNQEWQEKVKQLIQISRLVVIQPGASSNIKWELSTVIENKQSNPTQLLISFLDWQNLNRTDRREQYMSLSFMFQRIKNITLPKWRDDAYFLYFKAGWIPVLGIPNPIGNHVVWKNTKDPKILSALLPFFNQ